MTVEEAAAQFQAQRPMLLRAAYRMLGSMADAEDIVHDAWLRWTRKDRSDVVEPGAFLRRIVTRLCVDQLKSAHTRHEDYFGPWLPEPVIEEDVEDDVTLPLMLALERLSPLERAAFLLHDVFGESFDDVSLALGRDAAACRQLASRARRNVREDRPRFPLQPGEGQKIAEAFFAASRHGEIGQLGALLASDVTFYSDGGGKRPAVSRVLRGASEVVRAHAAIARLLRPGSSQLLRFATINGLPGFVTREADGEIQTTALLLEDGAIKAIYVMRNPEKLRWLKSAMH